MDIKKEFTDVLEIRKENGMWETIELSPDDEIDPIFEKEGYNLNLIASQAEPDCLIFIYDGDVPEGWSRTIGYLSEKGA